MGALEFRLELERLDARAKALILWNRESDHVRSAFAPRQRGDEH
jgi:hypothetical protein